MNTLEILIQAKDQASKELEGVSRSLDGMSKQLKIVGAAMTAVGVAGLKMVADARKLNAELSQTGITLGFTTKEMRSMALEITDVTFSLQSVTATFEVLARAGIRGEEQLKATAIAFDALADATGSSAEVVADMLIPAFKTFGVAIPQSAEELDKFTWLVKNTSVNLQDFASVMNYVAREGGDLGVTMDDMISIMAILEARGISGTAATMLFRQAVTEASNTGQELNAVLGITNEELAIYNTKIGEEAVNATQKYADAANEQYGLMDKLKQKFQEITFAAGSFLTPLEPILALMTAMGPVMMFFGTAQGKAAIMTLLHAKALIVQTAALVATKVALVAATVAQWALNVAMSANPIGLVILAIAGLIAGLIALIKNWDKIKDAFGKGADYLKTTWGKVGDFFQKIWDGIVNTFKTAANFIAGIINGLIGGFESFLNFFVGGLNFFINGINRIIGGINKILPGAIELAVIPTIGEVKLGRVPLMDSGGLIRGPGVFEVGPGVTEIAREPSSGEVHIHVGYLLGDELSLNKFARIIKQRIQQDDRRTAFGPVNQGYYYGRSST